jgi:hypothetical protein
MVWKPTTYKVLNIKRPFESFREEPKKTKKDILHLLSG